MGLRFDQLGSGASRPCSVRPGPNIYDDSAGSSVRDRQHFVGRRRGGNRFASDLAVDPYRNVELSPLLQVEIQRRTLIRSEQLLNASVKCFDLLDGRSVHGGFLVIQ